MRRLCADESGQSLIIVALSMTVVIAIAAFAIDVGSWYAKHHQAQVVADSAALAAANCLANPGHATSMNINGTIKSVPACSNGTDIADATTVAQDYATANGVTINANQVTVNTTSDTVLVSASPAAPAFFANLFGIHSSIQKASSTAGWTAGSTASTCTTATQSQCAAIYAANKTCSGTGIGAQIGTTGQGGYSISVNGVIHSEGQLGWPGSNLTLSASALTVAGSCYSSGNLPSIDGIKASQVASQPWPVNYAAAPYFTACTPNVTCVTVGGEPNVPPYCTQVSEGKQGNTIVSDTFTNINNIPDLPYSGNVYCAIGTGTSSDPSTWNGPINFEASMPANNQASSYGNCPGFTKDTFIGGTVTFLGSYNSGVVACMKPQLDNCLIYTTGNVGLQNGRTYWNGDIFAPSGTIQIGSSYGGDDVASTSGMLEALNVFEYDGSFTLTGDGPPATVTSGGSSSSNGTDKLLQ